MRPIPASVRRLTPAFAGGFVTPSPPSRNESAADPERFAVRLPEDPPRGWHRSDTDGGLVEYRLPETDGICTAGKVSARPDLLSETAVPVGHKSGCRTVGTSYYDDVQGAVDTVVRTFEAVSGARRERAATETDRVLDASADSERLSRRSTRPCVGNGLESESLEHTARTAQRAVSSSFTRVDSARNVAASVRTTAPAAASSWAGVTCWTTLSEIGSAGMSVW